MNAHQRRKQQRTKARARRKPMLGMGFYAISIGNLATGAVDPLPTPSAIALTAPAGLAGKVYSIQDFDAEFTVTFTGEDAARLYWLIWHDRLWKRYRQTLN